VLAVPFGDDEQGEQDDRGGHHGVGPGGPAEVAPLDERDDEQGRGRGEQADAGEVEAGGRVLSAAAGQDAPAERGGGDAERDVDQEDGAPLAAEQVQVKQPAGQDGPGHHGQAHQGADRHQRLAQVLGREHDLHQGQPLWDHDRAEEAL
jgi:hypothetical protein